MAMETIERMSGNIHLQVGRKLQIRTSQILSEITDGEYQDVQMDAASHMTVTTWERSGSTGMSQPRHSGADLFCHAHGCRRASVSGRKSAGDTG